MANPSLAQTPQVNDYSAQSTGQTVTLNSAAQSGDSIIVAIAVTFGSITFTVSDSGGSTYTLDEDGGSGLSPRVYIYRADNVGAITTVTVTPSASATWHQWIFNLRGTLSSGSFDAGNAGHVNSGTTADTISTSASTTFAVDFCIAITARTGTLTPGTPTTGWTDAGAASSALYECAYMLTSSTGTQSATWGAASSTTNVRSHAIACYMGSLTSTRVGLYNVRQAVNRAAVFFDLGARIPKLRRERERLKKLGLVYSGAGA